MEAFNRIVTRALDVMTNPILSYINNIVYYIQDSIHKPIVSVIGGGGLKPPPTPPTVPKGLPPQKKQSLNLEPPIVGKLPVIISPSPQAKPSTQLPVLSPPSEGEIGLIEEYQIPERRKPTPPRIIFSNVIIDKGHTTLKAHTDDIPGVSELRRFDVSGKLYIAQTRKDYRNIINTEKPDPIRLARSESKVTKKFDDGIRGYSRDEIIDFYRNIIRTPKQGQSKADLVRELIEYLGVSDDNEK